MSIEKTKKVVRNFLLDKSAEVLSIKGLWGVGKTYFWNEAIKQVKDDPGFCRDKYCYVSLFGIESLAQLKMTIFENVEYAAHIGKGFSIDDLKQSVEKLANKWGRQSLRVLPAVPYAKDAGSLAQSITFRSVTDALICIDDLERKGEALSTKDVLGLISLLKEERNCKVVMIFSDANFDKVSAEEYAQFREKVVDFEVRFSPSPAESAAHVFTTSEIDAQLSAFTKALQISNIRILQRIRKAACHAVDLLQDFDPQITRGALQTLVLFGWCYYSHNEQVPSYEYVKSLGYRFGTEKKTEKELRWDVLLREYNFQVTDELDVALSSIVENGFVDEDLVRKEAEKVAERLAATQSRDAFNEPWTLYHDTFENNDEEIVRAFEKSFKSHIKYASPSILNSAVSLLRELKRDELAAKLIDLFIDAHGGNREIFDLSSQHIFGQKPDQELVNKFNGKVASLQEALTIESVLAQIGNGQGWNAAHEAVLASATADDFYRIFKAVTGKTLHSYVDASLKFGQFGNATEGQIAIAGKAKAALLRIGSESMVNRIRVARYGVYSEEQSGA